jgi:hypothetical protein
LIEDFVEKRTTKVGKAWTFDTFFDNGGATVWPRVPEGVPQNDFQGFLDIYFPELIIDF